MLPNLLQDWSGQGLLDIEERRLRTPLEPLSTFSDDPLRVLRALRFSADLGFTLAPELLQAARNPDLHQALATSIARERIGTELMKLLSSSPAERDRVLPMLGELGLLPSILPVPSSLIITWSPSASLWEVSASNLLHWL